jgi:PAT family beta-lactamase induction signal transducer AmpG
MSEERPIDGLNRSTTGKLFILGALYLSQGLPYGFFVQALPVLLRNQGLSLGAIGMSSLLAIPWGLKFLWSPAVDRLWSAKFGRRKSWIVPAQLLSVLTLLALAFTSLSQSLSLVLVFVFLSNAMTATQDIATDGLALDLMRPDERGLANGIKVSAYRGGMIIGGGALLAVYDRIAWQGSYLVMAALIVLASVPLLLFREAAPGAAITTSQPKPFAFFSRPQAARILFVLITYKLGDAFSTGMLKPFFVDLGLSLAQIGYLVGTVGFLAGLLGAFAGGALVNRLGRRRSLVIFGLLQAAAVAGYAYMAYLHPSEFALAVVIACEHFASGMATAALFTCMMDWSSKESAATDYSIQASAVVVATLLASSLSGLSANAFGYPRHFAIATVFACVSVAIVLWTFPAPAQDEMRSA